MQIREIDLPAKARHGTVWWEGNWQCRNHHGYLQTREEGKGYWMFEIPWFSNDDVTCTVLGIDCRGELMNIDETPIDDQNRITVLGRKWGYRHWRH